MPAGHGGAEGMKKCMVPRFARTIDRAARSARFARAYQMLKNSSYGKFLTPQIDVPESTSEPD